MDATFAVEAGAERPVQVTDWKPADSSVTQPLESDPAGVLELLRWMWLSRWVDRVEMELVNRGEAFFHVGAAGHESSAVLHRHLTSQDWLHLHYRDKALMLARGLPVIQFFHSSLCTADSHSAGRQMSAHLSDPGRKILSLVGPVGNNGLQAVGVAAEVMRTLPPASTVPIVVCAVGDSASQQGEFLEAIAESVRSKLPVLFWIEDNGYGISTRTAGNTFYDHPQGPAADFYGIPIKHLDGRDVFGCDRLVGEVVRQMRREVGPAIVVFQVARLTHHTNADDERVYRNEREIAELRLACDPIRNLLVKLRELGFDESRLATLEREVEAEVRAAANQALASPNPLANFDARPPLLIPSGNHRATARNGKITLENGKPVTLLEALREVLRQHLENDVRVTLYGQDIEDPKGDVFGLTRGLSRTYPGRVRNSALSESTIVGVSIGRALAGGRPVACIQFADFLPLAFNQIATELGSMFWRTDGGWRCPVILLAPCGGYRPGLGPFHAQTFESLMAHVPGVDVMMPSNAADAAAMLNAAFENQDSGRPTIFLYPKVCLNDPVLAARASDLELVLQPGVARFITSGEDLTLVSWGATVPLCLKAVQQLEAAGVHCDLIDLRSLAPWDSEAVCESVRRTGRLIVVHEDNLTCGFASEVLATVLEHLERPIQARRITRADTYVPCNYVNQLDVLPSIRRVLEAASVLCDLEFKWIDPESASDGVFVLEAVGSSPADQNVTVLEWKCPEGAEIHSGQLVAECEADKATFELRSPVDGRISGLLPVGERVAVGTALARIQTRSTFPTTPRRVPAEGRAVLSKRSKPVTHGIATPSANAISVPAVLSSARSSVLAISAIAAAPAGRIMTNEELVKRFPGRTAQDILQRTGIESRPVLAEGETALTLATKASRAALRAAGLNLSDLDAIIVSTSSPISLSPSMACLLHHELGRHGPTKDLPASDILAACTGYLYALQSAFDFCQSRPSANILVVTAEAMTRFTNPEDFDTAIVFADAATATLVHGSLSSWSRSAKAYLHRPVLSARGEDGTVLHHGRRDDPNVNMDGLKVFPLAVRQMMSLLEKACVESHVSVADLAQIIPHQANGRILEAVAARLNIEPGRLINRVRHSGNTSSSTIPLVLADFLAASRPPRGKVGLCAFGGGFTFGAAVLEYAEAP